MFHGRRLETNVVSEPFASSGCFSNFTVFALSKYATTYRVHISMVAQFVSKSINENRFSIDVNRNKVLDYLALTQLNLLPGNNQPIHSLDGGRVLDYFYITEK
jgi:hypothetical protein